MSGLLAAAGGLGAPADQPHLLEARQMQALSFMVHIPLVCFGIAFPAMVLFVEGLWLRTGDPVYKALAMRWSKVMLILFAVGVVTGTILSFELGLLWPNFMATFGEVFGFAFALEGISFFVEAIFIAIYVYGWDRLSRRAHMLAGIPIVIAGITGSLFVISVNGWMNNPTGFRIEDGEVVDVKPLEALFNSHLPHELVHMYLAGIIVAGFLVAAVYSRAWLQGKRDRYHRTALVVPLTFAALAAPVQPVVGDWAARTVAESQPVKLAAFESLDRTTRGAPLDLGGIVEIPKLLSLLAFHDPDATVEGLDAVPKEDRPPDGIVHFSFEFMVAVGTALAALAAFHLATWWRRRRLPSSRWFHRAVIAAAPLSLLALIAGWVTTEVGRQPWVVYEVMRTEEAVTGLDGIPLGYAFLAATYIALGALVVWLLRRLAHHPLETEDLMLPELCLALMLLGLTAYAVLGGADFGAGFWDLTAGGAERGARVRGMVKRSMAPVWEANHVWLIFVLVVFWSAFPVAFGSVMSTLGIPLLLAAVGIILRGGAFAVRGEAATIAEARVLGAVFALASVLVPFFLGAAVGGVASGRVPVGNAAGDALDSWWNPTSGLIGALAVATGAYLAAVFLAADSVRAGLPDLVRAFKLRALGAGAVAGALALGGMLVVREDARPLYDGLTEGGGLAMVLASAVLGIATLALVWRERFGWARVSAAGAVTTIVAGWALAQSPDLLPGQLTLDQAAAGDATLVAILVGLGVGALVLVPSLALLYRLTLSGRLDQEFRPITAGKERR